MAKVALVTLAAVALGAGAAFGDTVSYEPTSYQWVAGTLANLPFFWALLAFAAGALTGGWPKGAAAGALSLAVAVAVYYGTHSVFGLRSGVDNSTLVDAGEVWLAVAVPAGLVFGLAGRLWRAGPAVLRTGAVGVLASSSGALALVSFEDAGFLVIGMAALTVFTVVALLPRVYDAVAALLLGLALTGITRLVLQLADNAANNVR